MAVNVISPGLSTTVQDLGRPGYYHLGIPLSGGMDRFALRAANMLVGNDEGAAVLDLQRASRFIPTKTENYKGIEAAARNAGLL